MYQPPQNKQVSIVIPNWFEENQSGKYGENETLWFARECIKRILEVTPRDMYELVLIDNGSTIGQDIFCMADILIRNKHNLGFGPACNQGFVIARGEYIVCINNDVLVWPGWLDALITPLNDKTFNPPVGVVMPALMKETRDAREALKIDKIDLSQNRGIYGIGAEFGSCWVMERKLLEQLKQTDGYYFDEKFLVGFGEDRDLWDRVRKAGYETYRTHETRVFHQGNMSMGKVKDRKSYTLPNREYLAQKRASRPI